MVFVPPTTNIEIGKRVGGDTYVHRDATGLLHEKLSGVLERAITLAGTTDWNVAKVAASRASLLLYEDFDQEAFPALLRATTINLAAGTVKVVDYGQRHNPPILHRKELLLRSDDPRRPRFAALTRAAEDQGLFRNTNRIGTRRVWLQLIDDAGLELQGQTLIEKGATVIEVARHKTAMVRRDLSQPVALMRRWGLFDQSSTVFDYGCGQGDDIGILREQEAGVPVADLCRKHGVSEGTIYAWKAKYGGMSVSDAQRLRAQDAAIDHRRERPSIWGMNNIKVALTAVLMLPCIAHAQPSATPETVLAQAARYTVKISASTTIGLNEDDGVSGNGAGFLIDRQRGWVLTNAHVATRSPVVLQVAFKDQPWVDAKRIHIDSLIDMAIIHIDPKSIPTTAVAAELDCTGLPAVGAPVAAFGHPWGLNFTATRGIVSGEPWLFPREYIQTDAILNHGNSGGPLINLSSGKVVGLSARTYNPEQGEDKHSSSLSLAEPIPAICRIVELLKAKQDTRLKLLPVALATAVDDPRPRIAQVTGSSSLLPGDLIVGVNGSSGVRNMSDLATRLRGDATTAKITVERGGQQVTVTSPLRSQQDPLTAKDLEVSGLIIGRPWIIDDAEESPGGNLVIDFIVPGSPAEKTRAFGWRSRLIAVDGKAYSDVDTLRADLAKKPADAQIEFFTSETSYAATFLRAYHYFTLPRGELPMVSVQ